MATTTNIAVVGGGLAGLVAGTVAARAGGTVTIYEARAQAGGRARTDNRKGYLLNQGAHALYAGFAGIRVLRELEIDPAGGKPATRGYGRLRGKVGLMPSTPMDSLRSTMIGLRAKVQLGKLLADPRKALTTPADGRTMQQWINEQVTDPDARLVLAMAARTATYQAELDSIAASVAVPQLVGALVDGVYYLDGGWQQLISALREAAVRAGARVVTDRKIASLDDVADADAVILAVGGPSQVDRLLGGRSAVVSRWAAQAQPVFAASLDLGLRSLPVPARRICFGVDEPLYFSAHTPSARLAPAGGEVVHVLRYATPSFDGDTVRAEMEAFLDAAQPGWRSHVVAEQFAKQWVVAHDRPTQARGGFAGRPGPAIPDVDGVFVAGDWVGPTGLLADAALSSGRDAALLVVSRQAAAAGGQ